MAPYTEERFHTREEWGAQNRDAATSGMAKLKYPKREVYLHHGVSSGKAGFQAESAQMRSYQQTHISRWGTDLGYSVGVGQSGDIYEGRDFKWDPSLFDYQGAHTDRRNSWSIGIVAIGNFEEQEPSVDLLLGIAAVIQLAISLGKVAPIPGNIPFEGASNVYPTAPHKQAKRAFAGKSTACCGKNLIVQLPAIRHLVGEVSLWEDHDKQEEDEMPYPVVKAKSSSNQYMMTPWGLRHITSQKDRAEFLADGVISDKITVISDEQLEELLR